MKTETTLSKINSELIQTFATLDAWFDKISDDGLTEDEHFDLREMVHHIVTSNNHLLYLLSEGCDFALNQFNSRNDGLVPEKTLDDLRFILREQLFQCLCLIDELELADADCDDTDKQMSTHDRLWSIAHHLNHHLEQLESAPV